ncbi:hypothetical protein ACP6PM_34625 [Dapis sp. BLCC M229]
MLLALSCNKAKLWLKTGAFLLRERRENVNLWSLKTNRNRVGLTVDACGGLAADNSI